MTFPDLLTTLVTELGWNLAVWLPTLLISLLFIRAVLGVRLEDLSATVFEPGLTYWRQKRKLT